MASAYAELLRRQLHQPAPPTRRRYRVLLPVAACGILAACGSGGAAAPAAVAVASALTAARYAAAPGGAEAIQLKVAEQYIAEFGKVINNADTIILPSNLGDVASMITTAMSVVAQAKK